MPRDQEVEDHLKASQCCDIWWRDLPPKTKLWVHFVYLTYQNKLGNQTTILHTERFELDESNT